MGKLEIHDKTVDGSNNAVLGKVQNQLLIDTSWNNVEPTVQKCKIQPGAFGVGSLFNKQTLL